MQKLETYKSMPEKYTICYYSYVYKRPQEQAEREYSEAALKWWYNLAFTSLCEPIDWEYIHDRFGTFEYYCEKHYKKLKVHKNGK